jgi:G3E family GTPase
MTPGNSAEVVSVRDTLISMVPTNIITGFLGVGKTSAILKLLKSKPANERWAVLVNEFGEIGVDGSLFAGQHAEEQGVFIREVPGGCMCCAAGLPMQVALNQLLARAKPDRLLIEPTGLGHPKEVLEVLGSEMYQDILAIQQTITLVDARKLCDERYTGHATFNQQLAMADVIVGNKMDLYQSSTKDDLYAYVHKNGLSGARVVFAEHGEIEPFLLSGSSTHKQKQAGHDHGHHHDHDHDHDHHHDHDHRHESPVQKPILSEQSLPTSGYLAAVNEGEGFQSMGWRFSPDKVFDHKKLFSLLSGLTVERMKAVIITSDGVFGYNLTLDALTEVPLDDCMESRIEIICRHVVEHLEVKLMQCIL